MTGSTSSGASRASEPLRDKLIRKDESGVAWMGGMLSSKSSLTLPREESELVLASRAVFRILRNSSWRITSASLTS